MGPGNQTQILRVGSKYQATFGPWRDSFRQEPRFFLGVDLFQSECPLTKFREHSRPQPGCFARRRVLSSYLGNTNRANHLWNSRSRNPKHLRSNDLPALPQHPVACQPGSLPVPPLEGSRHRLRSPYATNFRIDPPIARLWRRSNGKTVSTADGSL